MRRSVRILIVEDEAIVAMWLRTMLEREGHTVVDVVADGAAAIAAAQRDRPEVILMDIQLAGPMDGVEAAHRITTTQRCQIVFMSGYAEQLAQLRREPEFGAWYIDKPVQIADLVPVLQGA